MTNWTIIDIYHLFQRWGSKFPYTGNYFSDYQVIIKKDKKRKFKR